MVCMWRVSLLKGVSVEGCVNAIVCRRVCVLKGVSVMGFVYAVCVLGCLC